VYREGAVNVTKILAFQGEFTQTWVKVNNLLRWSKSQFATELILLQFCQRWHKEGPSCYLLPVK